jgi:uncharacterized protein (TIGR04141 family)
MAKLSLYLGRTGRAPSDLIKAEYRDGGDNELPVAETVQALPFPATAYLVKGSVQTPSWARFVGPYFDVTGIVNVSTAFVLTFRAARRSWAITFGTGFHAIDLGAVEPGFGLRVCANCLDPEAVRSMENRRLGAVTRQQRTHVSRGSRINELGVVLDQDWVRYLAGRSAADDLAGTLAGSDALALTTDLSLAELPSLCAKILRRFRASEYRDGFAFIDQLRPLRKSEMLVDQLDAEVGRRVERRDVTDLHLAPPYIPNDSRLAGYRIWANRKHRDIDELDIGALYQALDELEFTGTALDTIHVADLADDGSPGSRDPLSRYLVAELLRTEKLYVHSLGSWFEVDRDYAATITRQVAALDDLTEELGLPEWDGRDEADYSEMVAAQRGWVLMDAQFIHHGGRDQKIEVCDLLTNDDEHLCVKRAESSATLSHLFNQAAVVSELYRNDDEFCRKAKDKLESLAPGRSFPDLVSPRFVYAIGTTKPGPLADSLFFFSKLTLVAKATEIRGRGSRVALAKIHMTRK